MIWCHGHVSNGHDSNDTAVISLWPKSRHMVLQSDKKYPKSLKILSKFPNNIFTICLLQDCHIPVLQHCHRLWSYTDTPLNATIDCHTPLYFWGSPVLHWLVLGAPWISMENRPSDGKSPINKAAMRKDHNHIKKRLSDPEINSANQSLPQLWFLQVWNKLTHIMSRWFSSHNYRFSHPPKRQDINYHHSRSS